MLQLLLPAADLHPDDRRPDQRRRLRCFFTVVAVLVSNLAAQVRGCRRVTAQARARTTEALYAFSRKLAGVTHPRRRALGHRLPDRLAARACRSCCCCPTPTAAIAVRAGYPPEDTLEPADIAAAKWSYENNRPAGRGADTLPGARRLFMPLRTGRGAVGVVGLDTEHPGPLLTPEQRRLFDALSDQAARRDRAGEPRRGRRDRHARRRGRPPAPGAAHLDLPRPAHAARRDHRLGRHAARLRRATSTEADRAELLGTDPGRVRAPQPLHRQPPRHDPARIRRRRAEPRRRTTSARSSAARCSAPPRCSPATASTVELADDLPMVDIDPVLFEQVLFNLLDNAAKYAPEGTTVRIEARPTRRRRRRAPGARRGRRASRRTSSSRSSTSSTGSQKGDRVRAGTGLGLAVCRGFVEAMGGTITAGNRAGPLRRRLHHHPAGRRPAARRGHAA